MSDPHLPRFVLLACAGKTYAHALAVTEPYTLDLTTPLRPVQPRPFPASAPANQGDDQ